MFTRRLKQLESSLTVISWLIVQWILLPAGAVLAVIFCIQDIGPAYRALVGDGTSGTFTVTRLETNHTRGHTSQMWFGDFQSADGQSTRQDVAVFDEPASIEIGAIITAIDTGDRNGVYGTGRRSRWTLITGILAVSIIGLAYWIYRLRCYVGQRQRRGTPLERSKLKLGPRKFGPLGYELRNLRTGRLFFVRNWDGVFSKIVDEETDDGPTRHRTALSIDGRVREQIIDSWGQMPKSMEIYLDKRRQ